MQQVTLVACRCPSQARTDRLMGVQQSGVDALLQTLGGLASRGLFWEEVCEWEQC